MAPTTAITCMRRRIIGCFGRRGFTLLELLMTLAVMVLLGGLGLAALGGLTDSRSLDSAQGQLHALARVARSQAVLNGTDARLIINCDANDPERFLRFAGVIKRDLNDPTKWEAAHPGLFLPQGIFVVPQDTNGVQFVNWETKQLSESMVSDRKSGYQCASAVSQDTGLCYLEYPKIGLQVDSIDTNPKWITYQFSPNGRIVAADVPDCSGSSAPNGLHISLAPGNLNSGNTVVFENSYNVVGIRIRQNGYSFAVDDPDAL